MKEGAIDWDQDVSEKDAGNEQMDGFVVLPEGDYKFTVDKAERGQFKGSANLPACNQVKVGIIVDGGEKGKSYVWMRFYMHTKMLWKIYQFLTAVGLHKKGEGSGPIPWGKVVKGVTGRCHIVEDEYKGEKRNDVSKWLAPSSSDDEDYD